MSFLGSIFRFIWKALCAPEQQQQGQQQQQQQWQKPPVHEQPGSYPPPSRPPHHEQPEQKPHRKPFQNDYLANAQNPEYLALRQRADKAYDEMRESFAASQRAYDSGDGARAKELSNEGKAHRAEGERAEKVAAEWLFQENNKGRDQDEIDLHGLRVKEAIERTDNAIVNARQNGHSELRLIVGKGLHSENHVAKIKPAIEELMQKHNIVAEIDPDNAGVLIVYLGGHRQSTGREVDPDEITRRLAEDEKSCTIM